MEEWEMARWRSRASLHFLGSPCCRSSNIATWAVRRKSLRMVCESWKSLGMFNPPRATDLRFRSLDKTAGMPDSYRRMWDKMEMRADGGWHASGFAVCRDNRPPDLILFCTQNADGEWVVRTTATPLYFVLNICATARNTDFEFVGSRPPQDAQLGAWEVDFPPGIFALRGGTNCLGLGAGFFEREFLLPSGRRP